MGMRVVRGKNKRMVVLQNKISKQSVAALPKVNFEGRIFVVNTEAEARKAISYLNTHSIVGVDTETRPSFKKGTSIRWLYCRYLHMTLVSCFG